MLMKVYPKYNFSYVGIDIPQNRIVFTGNSKIHPVYLWYVRYVYKHLGIQLYMKHPDTEQFSKVCRCRLRLYFRPQLAFQLEWP